MAMYTWLQFYHGHSVEWLTVREIFVDYDNRLL